MKFSWKSYLSLITLSVGSVSGAAVAENPVGTCKVTVSNAPSRVHSWSLYDSKKMRSGSPIFISFNDKSGEEKQVLLTVEFGSKNRILSASWADDSSYTPPGASYTIRPLVSRMRTRLQPGLPVYFQYGDSELSPNPTILLTCELNKDAGPFNDQSPDCVDCDTGGSSASN